MSINIDRLKKLYADGYSLNRLQSILGVHRTTLSKYLKLHGQHVKYHENYVHLNINYFDDIDCEEKAYLLGLIYSDGNINTKYNRFSIDLSSKDIDILQKVSNLLYGKDFVKKYSRNGKEYCKIDVHSAYMVKKLVSYGLKDNKTFNLEYPNFLKNNLNRHFIRGMIDGDGCIYLPKNNRNSPSVSIVGTKNINDNIKIIYDKLSIKSYNCKVTGQDFEVINDLRVKSYKRCKLLLDWLYDGASIYLDRKYNLYKLFLIKYHQLHG